MSNSASMSPPRAYPSRPWHREPFVWLVVSIPVSSVVFSAIMIALAVQSYDGLVADDYYKRGMEINRALARDSKAAMLMLEAQLTLRKAQDMELRLGGGPEFTLPEAVTLKLIHATRSGFDRRLVLSRLPGTNRYRATEVEFAPGHWYLQVETSTWRLTTRVSHERLEATAKTGAPLMLHHRPEVVPELVEHSRI